MERSKCRRKLHGKSSGHCGLEIRFLFRHITNHRTSRRLRKHSQSLSATNKYHLWFLLFWLFSTLSSQVTQKLTKKYVLLIDVSIIIKLNQMSYLIEQSNSLHSKIECFMNTYWCTWWWKCNRTQHWKYTQDYGQTN